MLLPSGVRTARLIAYLQGALALLRGAGLVFGGAAYAKALGMSGTGGTTLFVATGVVVLAISALVIWGANLVGRLSRRARIGVLVFEYASVIFGVSSFADPLQAALRIVLAVVAIYYLQFDSRTRAVFAPPTD